MSTWHCKELGDGMAALGPSLQIGEAFVELIKVGGISPDLAVFSRYDLDTNIVSVYFSPSASLLASAFGATPCDKPIPQSGFSLLVGDNRSWETHFPGYLESRRNQF